MCGKPILAPEAVRTIAFDKIIIASDYFREILPQLRSYGIKDNDILVLKEHEHDRNSLSDKLMRKVSAALCEYSCRYSGLISKTILTKLLHRALRSPYIKLERMNILWLDKATTYQVYEFRSALCGVVQAPRFIGRNTPPTAVQLPAVGAYRFSNATVSSGSRTVILAQSNQVVIERLTTATEADADYSQTDLYFHNLTHALVRTTSRESLPKGIIINSSNEVNYYHWMIDALAQLQFCAELPDIYDDYPILISATSQKMEAVKAMMDAINIRRSVIFLKNLISYEVADLLYISQPNNMLPHLRHGSFYKAQYAFARPESIFFLREKGLQLSRSAAATSRPQRIILGRRGNLRQYNQDELMSLGNRYGFTPIYLEDMNFAEQVATVANAKMIIGPSGAAWTNLIFASPNARGLCWAAAEQGEASCFSNLAAIVGMKLDHLAYSGGSQNTRFLHSLSYQLDLGKVEAWMKETIAETTDCIA